MARPPPRDDLRASLDFALSADVALTRCVPKGTSQWLPAPAAIRFRSPSMPDRVRRAIRGVLTDIDDTLTTDGKLTADAYAALQRLHGAGRIVIPVTGRPAGLVRSHRADVARRRGRRRDGAFYMHFDARHRKLVRRFMAPDAAREADRVRLASVAQRFWTAFPAARWPRTSAIAKPISRSTIAKTSLRWRRRTSTASSC